MSPASTSLRDPCSLLSERRLDIAVKWRLFRHLATGRDADAIRVYRCHIQGRTGGIEPGSWKTSLDDYVRGAGALYASMAARGFDPAHPVPLAASGRLAGGAHRLACALALRLEVHVVTRAQNTRPGVPWDRTWLAEHGMPSEDLDRIEADFRHLRDCRCPKPS